jgi:dethiobiotin synthetase
MRGLFVTGTDTGVGKSVVTAALVASMVAAGERVRAHKPVVTGLDEPPDAAGGQAWPADHELLAAVANMRAQDVSPLRFGLAVSPHLAAELAGERIDPAALLAHARGEPDGAASTATEPRLGDEETLIVEGVGGLLVPLSDAYTVRDFARDLGLPVVIAARTGLGTINHTLLTLHAARTAGLEVAAVVLTPWSSSPDAIERSNHETIERLGDIDVQTLAHVERPSPAGLAAAGDSVPWRQWLR